MSEEKSNIATLLLFPMIIVMLMIVVETIEVVYGISLSHWGIYPRDLSNLTGIITGPFVHKDWEHLISNALPMIMLLSIMMLFYRKVAISSFIIITLLTGFVVWMFARDSYHIGASGVVYGLVAFVAWSGVFRRNLKSIILALIILTVYGGYFHGIVPNKEGVSWESHLFGGLVGIFTAYLFKNVKEDDEIEKPNPWAEEEGNVSYFLPRDTFEKTKLQRYLDSLKEEEEEE